MHMYYRSTKICLNRSLFRSMGEHGFRAFRCLCRVDVKVFGPVEIMIALIFTTIFFSSCYATDRPHVIFIVADDLGWNDVGFHGSDQIPTPNIDALAYGGVILENYYVMQLCTPSRSALMTGMHPIHTGMQHGVVMGGEPWGLPLELKILPQFLKDDGYATHAVGKWHLGNFVAAYTPEMRGFDSHFGYWIGKQDYFDHTNQETNMWGYDMRRGLNVSWESFGQYTTDLISDESVKLIESHDATKPMFLYVAHLAVHSANMYQYLQAPADIVAKFNYIKEKDRRIFAGMLWKMDESVGKIISALDKKGMLKNSVIVFTSDNGGPAAGFNNNAASNWPLRGVKDTLWEGGVRGGALVWSPQLPSSKINRNLMHIQDWLPTILDAVNSSSKETVHVDGHNMWPVLKEEKSHEYDELILNVDQVRNTSALRKGDWKIITGHAYKGQWDGWYGPSGRDRALTYDIDAVVNSPVAAAFRRNGFTFPSVKQINEIRKNVSVACDLSRIRRGEACLPEDNICLFNVAVDPCERKNRAEEEPRILGDLLRALHQYKPVPPLNKPFDPRSNPKYWNYTWTNWVDYI